jgi:hypothetical protein
MPVAGILPEEKQQTNNCGGIRTGLDQPREAIHSVVFGGAAEPFPEDTASDPDIQKAFLEYDAGRFTREQFEHIITHITQKPIPPRVQQSLTSGTLTLRQLRSELKCIMPTPHLRGEASGIPAPGPVSHQSRVQYHEFHKSGDFAAEFANNVNNPNFVVRKTNECSSGFQLG